ncbi:venom dipeptidyl peptidase 4 isoform X2 [Procambarus clarkii]|uniref:venom dipeptidyl peptidase 4 isoform X2 n=1 Tax=Procambarus clarkii TaxID=6728 RepID=UPI001E678651|nr:venom dipeptidyl peptidase 4-like isoform X2 [Procambarus clarkii]
MAGLGTRLAALATYENLGHQEPSSGGCDTLADHHLNPSESTELVGSTRSRVWRSLLLGTVGVMLLVAAGIATVIVTRSPSTAAPETSALTATPGGIDLAEVLNGTFSTESFNGTWISDNEFLYRPESGALNIFTVATQLSDELVSEEVMSEWRPFKYSLSPSRKYLLMVHDVQKLFRYSYLARHTILNLKTGETIPLAPTRVRSRLDQPPLLYATWAPTDDAMAFVSHNDLYYTTGPDLDTMYRLTDTGQIGSIFNGIPDWVYEEEILSSNSALWFNSNGKRLAFATFNDSHVDTMNFPLYGRPGDLAFQYPIQQSIKYPKPGRANPVVDLWVVDLSKLVSGSGETVTRLPPPNSLAALDHYFTSVGWATPDKVSIIWMNRHQNVNTISICSADTGACTDDLVHESPDHAWNDLYTAPMFDKVNGDTYLIIMPTVQGDQGNFKHINIRKSSDKTLIPLTTGTYEVVDILSWDQTNHIIYFTAAPAGKPGQRHIYYVGDLNSTQPKQAYCITCGFKNDFNEDCNYNSAEMSEKSTYYALTCSGPGIPQVTMHRSSDHSRLLLLEDNQEVREKLLDRSLPLEKRLEIDVAGGFKAQVSMKLPPDYNPTRFQSYPMLVYVYGGPGSQLVSDKFKIDWGDYLASERGIIYTSIDGRGSGYSGDKLLHALYYGLGTGEVDDQLAVTAALQKSFPFIDSSRTAIWGWSYGGYVTASVLSKDVNNIFKCGISVAPVTSWIYYDTVYTERYMGLPTPEDNFAAYDYSDVTRNVSNFKNKEFFLIHGTADDNVHYQQSMMLSRALEVEDILFRSQSYPDENHGLAGVKRHHYHSMEDFLDDCFNKT